MLRKNDNEKEGRKISQEKVDEIFSDLKPGAISWACMTCCSKLQKETRNFGQKLTNKTMIDTIILSIPKNKTITLDLTTNGIQAWDLQARTRVYDKFVKNPSPRDTETGRYFPRLTGYRRKNGKLEWESTLKIEFSAPKLIYENNIDELKDSQFEEVVEALGIA